MKNKKSQEQLARDKLCKIRYEILNRDKINERKRQSRRNFTEVQKEKERQRLRNWRKENREIYNAKRRKERKENPEKYRKIRRLEKLKYYYKFSQEEYDIMLLAQGGVCAICKSDNPRCNKKSKHFQIDHCHKTGKVRGLLCSNCNRGIGLLGDSIEIIERVMSYLNKEQKNA